MNSRRKKVRKWWKPKDDDQKNLFDDAKQDIKTYLTVTSSLPADKAYTKLAEYADGEIKFREMGFGSFGAFLFHCDDVVDVSRDGSGNYFLSLRGPVDEEAAHIKDLVEKQKEQKGTKRGKKFQVSSDQLLRIPFNVGGNYTDERKSTSPLKASQFSSPESLSPPVNHQPQQMMIRSSSLWSTPPYKNTFPMPFTSAPPAYGAFTLPLPISTVHSSSAAMGHSSTAAPRNPKGRYPKNRHQRNSPQPQSYNTRTPRENIAMNASPIQKPIDTTNRSSTRSMKSESQNHQAPRLQDPPPVLVTASKQQQQDTTNYSDEANEDKTGAINNDAKDTQNVLPNESKFDARLLGADEYGYVYVQISDPTIAESFDQLNKSLRDIYSQEDMQNKYRVRPEQSKIGLFIVAHVERAFVRAKVFEIIDNNYCMCQQIDYGTFTMVERTHIYFIEDSLKSLAPRAVICMISGTEHCMCSDEIGHSISNSSMFPEVRVNVICRKHPLFKVPLVTLHIIRTNHDVLYLMRRYGHLHVDCSMPKTDTITLPQASVIKFLEARCYYF